MKFLLLSGVSLLTIIGCQSHFTKVEVDPDLAYRTKYSVDRKTRVHDGPYIKTDSSGILLETGMLKGGKQDGIRELYYPDGQVKIRERYVLGRMDDLFELFHPNGAIELKGYYVQGEMYGLWRKYTPEGKLIEEVLMISNEENGPFREYYPNGKIQAEGAYLHGPNESGTLKLYDESGELYKTMLCYEGRCYTTWIKE